jgi:phage gp29-like protein
MKKVLKRNEVKLPANAPNPIVIQNIDVRPFNRTTQDIPNWRRAIQNAESRIPRRSLLYDLYADVVQDAHVIAVTGKRFDAVTNANWQFMNKDGKPVDAINELIDSSGFDDVVTEILNSKFWGYSVLEPTFYKDTNDTWAVEANLLPRLNYRPEAGVVAFNYASDEGINIREGIYAKTIMEVGKVADLGLLLSAAQYAILKRGGIGDYAMFVQVFGRPIIDATWDGFDESQRLKLLESLNIGPGGVIVRPDGTTVTILESKLTASTIHKDFKNDMNAEISKALLGTTETTESSSSSGFAQSKTHESQDNNKHESDINFVRKVLNSRFVKVLEAHGIITESGRFMIQGEETKLSTKESFEMHKSMVTDLGLPIDDDFFYETYGLPKPDNYDKLKAEKEAAKSNEAVGVMKEPAGKTEKIQPTAEVKEPTKKEVKLSWLKELVKLFQAAPTETIGASCGHHHIKLTFDESGFNETAFLERAYAAKGAMDFDFALFEHTAQTLLSGFKKGWDDTTINLSYAPGFTYNAPDPALLTSFEQNIFRFSGAKNLAEAQLLNELFRKSSSFNEFYNLAKGQVDLFNKDWLLTEYNTAIHVGAAASNYHRLLSKVDTFPYWTYTTAGDELVRYTHELLNGITLPANDPRWSKLFPPGDWNCRCFIVPKMKHEVNETLLRLSETKADVFLESEAFTKAKAQGWGVNRGEVGEVFTANQQYVNKFPGEASKLLNQLGAADFGLLSYAKMKEAATEELPAFNGKTGAFFKDLEIIGTNPVLRDYKNRPLELDPKNTEDPKLLNAMKQAISKPDEVWLNGKELDQLVFVKYYKDQTLVTTASVANNQSRLLKWMVIEDSIEMFRKGLLIQAL